MSDLSNLHDIFYKQNNMRWNCSKNNLWHIKPLNFTSHTFSDQNKKKKKYERKKEGKSNRIINDKYSFLSQ